MYNRKNFKLNLEYNQQNYTIIKVIKKTKKNANKIKILKYILGPKQQFTLKSKISKNSKRYNNVVNLHSSSKNIIEYLKITKRVYY